MGELLLVCEEGRRGSVNLFPGWIVSLPYDLYSGWIGELRWMGGWWVKEVWELR